jgi:hypothetical protein
MRVFLSVEREQAVMMVAERKCVEVTGNAFIFGHVG